MWIWPEEEGEESDAALLEKLEKVFKNLSPFVVERSPLDLSEFVLPAEAGEKKPTEEEVKREFGELA